MKRVALCVVALSTLSACAGNNQLYEWGSYQPALVSHTKAPDSERFVEELEETLAKAEKKEKVPPGLYAELGYLHLEAGNIDEAIAAFEKERQAFPESTSMMDRMIEVSMARGS